MVSPPALAAIRLPVLTDGDRYDLEPEATCDGFAFTDLDLTDVDLTNAALTDCRLTGSTGIESRWRAAHLTSCVIERMTLASLDATRGSWRGVALTESRIGSLDAHDGRVESVRFTGCRVGYLNLRHAIVKDVAFERCRIDELDLLEAHANRVRFADCEIGALNVHLAALADVDLTGASLAGITGVEYLKGCAISSEQLLDLAGVLAAALGLEIVA